MHMMVPSVIGLASCVFAFGAHAGTFLEDLAANHNRVESSPYATGGNVVLCLDATIGEYVHVFTNTTASSFVIESSAGNMSAKILAVGTALASQPVITGIWYHHSPSSGMTVILR